MIEQKVKAFRMQIRRRTNEKKMQKIRFLHSVNNQQKHSKQLDDILYLVACCKLHTSDPEPAPFQQLTQTLNKNKLDTNLYILTCQQISQTNLLAIVCQKIKDFNLICNFLISLLPPSLNQFEYQHEQRLMIGQVYRSMFNSSCFVVVQRFIGEILGMLGEGKCFNREKLHTVLYILQMINYQNFCSSQQLNQKLLQMLIKQHNNEPISVICGFLDRHFKEIEQQDVYILLQVIKFLKGKLCQMASYQAHLSELRLNADQNILQTLMHLFGDEGLSTNFITKFFTKQLFAQFLYAIDIQNPKTKFINLIKLAIRDYEQKICSSSSSHVAQDEIILKFILKISIDFNWLCYGDIDQFMRDFYQRIRMENKKGINGFYGGQYYGRECQDKSRIRDNIVITILYNLLHNQPSHSCRYDYYEIMELIADDLNQEGLLLKWCQCWRTAQNVQHLMLKLLNIKKQKIKQKITIIAINLLKWKNIEKQIKKKINLLVKLYGIKGYALIEDYFNQYQLEEQEDEIIFSVL